MQGYAFYTFTKLSIKAASATTNDRNDMTQSRIAAAHGQFNRIRQVAPMCTAI